LFFYIEIKKKIATVFVVYFATVCNCIKYLYYTIKNQKL